MRLCGILLALSGLFLMGCQTTTAKKPHDTTTEATLPAQATKQKTVVLHGTRFVFRQGAKMCFLEQDAPVPAKHLEALKNKAFGADEISMLAMSVPCSWLTQNDKPRFPETQHIGFVFTPKKLISTNLHGIENAVMQGLCDKLEEEAANHYEALSAATQKRLKAEAVTVDDLVSPISRGIRDCHMTMIIELDDTTKQLGTLVLSSLYLKGKIIFVARLTRFTDHDGLLQNLGHQIEHLNSLRDLNPGPGVEEIALLTFQ